MTDFSAYNTSNDIDNNFIDIDIICGFNDYNFAAQTSGSVWTVIPPDLPG
jgi:hypothetical protein